MKGHQDEDLNERQPKMKETEGNPEGVVVPLLLASSSTFHNAELSLRVQPSVPKLQPVSAVFPIHSSIFLTTFYAPTPACFCPVLHIPDLGWLCPCLSVHVCASQCGENITTLDIGSHSSEIVLFIWLLCLPTVTSWMGKKHKG